MTTLSAYIGRDNVEKVNILENGSLVPAGVVTKAVLKFGDYCIDTEADPSIIYFEDSDNQVLCFRLGLISGLTIGGYSGAKLTIYDGINTRGLAWATFTVIVNQWPTC